MICLFSTSAFENAEGFGGTVYIQCSSDRSFLKTLSASLVLDGAGRRPVNVVALVFPKKDILETEDWEELKHFKVLLEPFYLVTERVEGHASDGTYGAIWEVLPALESPYTKLKAQESTGRITRAQ